MYFVHWLNYGRFVGVSLRGNDGLYWLTPVFSEKLYFDALPGIMEEIGLLLAEWDGRNRQTRRNGLDGGGMEGPELAGTGSGAPPLAIEVR